MDHAQHMLGPNQGRECHRDAWRPGLVLGCTGQELPVCLSPSMGWLGNTARDTRVSPLWHCSARWAGTGLHHVSAACVEAACSCSGVHQHNSLITAVLQRQMSTEVCCVRGGMHVARAFSTPCTGKEGQE